MEYIIQILMLFIGINCLLKLSFRKGWQTVVFGFLCAVFIVSVCPFAILQSKTQLADFLNNTRVMQDTAVLITIESVICFGFCFFSLREIPGRKKGKGWMTFLDWYPGLLLFPVLFYLLTQIIFSLSGTSFTLIACLFAAAVLIGLPLLAWLIKRLYPEKEFRLELHFLVSLFVCIIGLITTVDGTVTYSAVNETFDAKALAVSATLFAVLFLTGYGWNKVKWRIQQKK
ncbi:hypothetical protein AGMMS4957_09210 [Bacteroidia bacterium]|nr:hypothetical protein AGMMS4957_09210 [Bacteroidia bacterium]